MSPPENNIDNSVLGRSSAVLFRSPHFCLVLLFCLFCCSFLLPQSFPLWHARCIKQIIVIVNDGLSVSFSSCWLFASLSFTRADSRCKQHSLLSPFPTSRRFVHVHVFGFLRFVYVCVYTKGKREMQAK